MSVPAKPKPKLGRYAERLHDALTGLAGQYREVGESHSAEHDVYHACSTLAKKCEARAEALAPHAERHAAEGDPAEPGENLLCALPSANGASPEAFRLLHDLRRLHLAIEEVAMLWVIVGQGAKGARDSELIALVEQAREEIESQLLWVTTRIKEAAPQALVA